jgi:hypothetical protein
MIKGIVATCIALLAVVGVASDAKAHANGIGAFGGHADILSQDCFSESYGGVYSSCSSAQWWEVNPPVYATGSYWSPTAVVAGTSFGTITCGADGASSDNNSIWTATQQTQGAGEASLTFSVWVPDLGHLLLACHMINGDNWWSVTY